MPPLRQPDDAEGTVPEDPHAVAAHQVVTGERHGLGLPQLGVGRGLGRNA